MAAGQPWSPEVARRIPRKRELKAEEDVAANEENAALVARRIPRKRELKVLDGLLGFPFSHRCKADPEEKGTERP